MTSEFIIGYLSSVVSLGSKFDMWSDMQYSEKYVQINIKGVSH